MLLGPSYELLDEVTSIFARFDADPKASRLEAALALLLCVGQLLVAVGDQVAREVQKALSEQHLRATVGWVPKMDGPRLTEALQGGVVADQVWSNLLTGGCIGDSAEALKKAATVLADRLLVDADWVQTNYLRAFTRGLAILSGTTSLYPQDVEHAQVPRCSPALVHLNGISAHIDRWAVGAFPALGHKRQPGK